MTDTQLLLAIGIPSFLVLLNVGATVWQARAVERTLGARVDALQQVMVAKFEAVDARFEAARQGLLRVEGVVDARLKHLEGESR